MRGLSSIGKSTILTIAGSVWGGGGPSGFCNTWLLTSNALDDTACAHSECFLALDEARLAGESPRDAARLVLHAAHRLAGGEGKARKGDLGPRQVWRLQFLGSTEHSLQQLGAIVGARVAAGQHVRIVDIAADAGRGLGVWEKLPRSITSPAQLSNQLREAAMSLYGTAADHYLNCLVAVVRKDKASLIAWLEKRMKGFFNAIGATEWQGVQARVARRFALVYAAGALACKYGILPWKRAVVLSAVKACHGRVIWPEVPVEPETPGQSIARVRDYIRRLRGDFVDPRKVPSKLTRSKIEGAPGLLLKGKDQRSEFAFSHSIFRNQVCSGADWERVWDHLSAAGLLNRHKGGKRSVTRAFPKPAERLRVISVKPTILDDADEKGPDGN